MDVNEDIEKSGLEQIFAILNIINIITERRKYYSWLRDTYRILKQDKEIFNGYKLLIFLATKILASSINNDTLFGFSSDFYLLRATYEGKDILDLPDSCDKIIVLKNLFYFSENIIHSKNNKELDNYIIGLKKYIKPFFKILNINFSVKDKNIDKKEAIKILSETYTSYKLHYIDGFPKSLYEPSIFRNNITKESISVCLGYEYALEFLWENLIGKSEFVSKGINNLHIASEIYKDKAISSLETENIIEPKKDLYENEINWDSLHFFSVDNINNIIETLNKRYKIQLGFKPLLELKHPIEKSFIKKFLIKPPYKTPKYLSNPKDIAQEIKRLDYYLFWYPLSVIHGDENVFTAANFIITFLEGMLKIKKINNEKESIKILKFIEEDGYVHQCSYFFLFKVYGTLISDFSGWIVFYRAHTQESNFDYIPRNMLDKLIHDSIKNGDIEIKEFNIDSDVLKNYLEKRSVSSVMDTVINKNNTAINFIDSKNRINLVKLKKTYEGNLGFVKGKLFEYVFNKFYKETGYENFCDVEFKTIAGNKEEVDFIAKGDKDIRVFELKLNQNEIDDSSIEKLNKKLKAVKERLGNKYAYTKWFGVFNKVDNKETVKKLKNNKIKIKDDLRSQVNKEIKNIFNINLKY
jgi:hypothetical protein